MNQNLKQNLTHQTISKVDGYPLYIRPEEDPYSYLVAPNPPADKAIDRAKFIDKTYKGWTDTNLRPGDRRATK